MRCAMIVLSIMILYSSSVRSTEYRPVTNVYNQYTTINNYSASSPALTSAMNGIDFTANIERTQIGIAGSVYEDANKVHSTAIAIGAGYRVCPEGSGCGLLKVIGGITEKENIGGVDGRSKSVTVGYSWAL